jgi:hypothetical protein
MNLQITYERHKAEKALPARVERALRKTEGPSREKYPNIAIRKRDLPPDNICEKRSLEESQEIKG